MVDAADRYGPAEAKMTSGIAEASREMVCAAVKGVARAGPVMRTVIW